MNLEDLKEQLKEDFTTRWAEIQESEIYNRGHEAYENLSPLIQKLIRYGVLGIVFLVLAFIPYSYLSSSSENIENFEDTRKVIRDLFGVANLGQGAPPISTTMSQAFMTSQINRAIDSFQLTDEQKAGVKASNQPSKVLLKKPFEQYSMSAELKTLNLQQIVDIGQKLNNIDQSIKMMGVEVTTNPKKGNYFDVVFKLAGFKMPAPPKEPVAKPKSKKSRSRRKNR